MPPGSTRARATVLGAYWIIAAGTISMQYGFSVIYVELLKSFDDSSTQTALVGSLCAALEEGGGAFVGLLAQRFGERRCAIVGGVLVGVGFCCSAAIGEAWQLLLTYSLLVGVGSSLSLYSAVMCINQWFHSDLGES